MAQAFSFATTTRRQEAALAFVARLAGQSVEDYLRDRFRDVVNDAITRFNQQRATLTLSDAYANALPADRAAVDALLGLP